jgi:hypothetical protein
MPIYVKTRNLLNFLAFRDYICTDIADQLLIEFPFLRNKKYQKNKLNDDYEPFSYGQPIEKNY